MEDILLDGHNRYEICEELALPYGIEYIELSDRDAAADWIDANQLGRRNLTDDQRNLMLGRRYNRAKKAQGGDRKSKGTICTLKGDTATALAKQHHVSARTVKNAGAFADAIEKAKAQEGARNDIRQKSDKGFESIDTKKEIAKVAGLSHDTIHKAKVISEKADDATKQKLRSGEVSINAAYTDIRGSSRTSAAGGTSASPSARCWPPNWRIWKRDGRALSRPPDLR